MSTAPSNQADELLTAEEFQQLPDDDQLKELFRGRVVYMTKPGYRHGRICAHVVFVLQSYLQSHPVGAVVSNDTGVVTERKPDTVRGPDVAFFSYERVPKDQDPKGWPEAMPELVFEVKSPEDRWKNIVRKVAEYLEAGVLVVCVLDPDTRMAHIYRPDEPTQMLKPSDEMAFPEWLANWRVKVGDLFG